MTILKLSLRQKKLLKILTQEFIETASSVGSQQLVNKYRLQYSPATVRNELALLEEMGYIQQPHVSAGRIPTDKGYRLYIDRLMRMQNLHPEEKDEITRRFEMTDGNINLLMEEASKILSHISHELGVVLTPHLSWGVFDYMEFIGLSENKVLVVLHVNSRMSKTVVLGVESQLYPPDLQKIAAILNERLSGLTLEEIKNTIQARIKDVVDVHPVFIKQVSESASSLFDFSIQRNVLTSGTRNMLNHPEFVQSEVLENILGLIDDRERLSEIFYVNNDLTDVTIGEENATRQLSYCSVVRSVYRVGKGKSTLGVIGPTRMNYSRILPLVEYMSETMSCFLS